MYKYIITIMVTILMITACGFTKTTDLENSEIKNSQTTLSAGELHNYKLDHLLTEVSKMSHLSIEKLPEAFYESYKELFFELNEGVSVEDYNFLHNQIIVEFPNSTPISVEYFVDVQNKVNSSTSISEKEKELIIGLFDTFINAENDNEAYQQITILYETAQKSRYDKLYFQYYDNIDIAYHSFNYWQSNIYKWDNIFKSILLDENFQDSYEIRDIVGADVAGYNLDIENRPWWMPRWFVSVGFSLLDYLVSK